MDLRAASLLVVVIASCGGEGEPVDACVWLPTLTIGQWRFARSALDGSPNIVPGFDLDGHVSTDTDPEGCFTPDFTSPRPDRERGVDNQLGPFTRHLPAAWYERGTGVNTSYRDAMLAGELTLELAFTITPEGCVTGVSLVIDGVAHAFVTDEIVRGRIRAHSSAAIPLPVYGGIDPVQLPIAAGAPLVIHYRGSTAATGTLGGVLETTNVAMAFQTMWGSDADGEYVRSLFEGQADLAPDASIMCQAISCAWTFSTEPWPPPAPETL